MALHLSSSFFHGSLNSLLFHLGDFSLYKELSIFLSVIILKNAGYFLKNVLCVLISYLFCSQFFRLIAKTLHAESSFFS